MGHKKTASHRTLGRLSLWFLVVLFLEKRLFHFVSSAAKDRGELEEFLSTAMNGMNNWLLGKKVKMYNAFEGLS